MRFRKSSHAVYKTEYHIVWTPRYRRKIFTSGVKEYAEKLIKNMDNLDSDIEVLKLNVQIDHVHMVVVIPPRVSVAEVVQFIKAQSGSQLKQKFPFLQKVFWGREGIWSRGYCVSTIGLNEKEILAYVEYQNKEDSGQQKLVL
ncbi:MAG: IS200/IS605 family transposase [archaeon]|jgi:putative transposase